MKKRQRIKCSGAISLALCITLPVILMLFTAVLEHSRRAAMETDLVRAVMSTAEGALSLYDRDLYREFGLFGVDLLSLTEAASTLIGPNQAEYDLEPMGALYDTSVLKGAIARHMTLRATTNLIIEVLDKFGALKNMQNEVPVGELGEMLPQGATAGYDAVDPGLEFDPEEGPPEWIDEYQDYMNDEVRAVYQEGLVHLSPAALPLKNGDMQSFSYNPFDSSGLDYLGTALDTILYTTQEGFLDRVMLCEYALAYFKNDAPLLIRNGMQYLDKTPDGRTILNFSPSRDHEVEEIATGVEGKGGSALVSLFIGTVRFVVRLIHIITDETKMADYRVKAVIVSIAIGAISVGHVVIDPEILTWIIVVSSALIKAASDTIQLRKGWEINFWPGDVGFNVPLRYRDYLRFLLVVQSPDKITERIANVIGRVHPGPYYVSLVCHGAWSDVRVTHAASFLGRENAWQE